MPLSIASIGILVNAFVCLMVAISALALVLSLNAHENKSTPTMQAYRWFWWFTFLVWFFQTFRYLFIGFGYSGPWITNSDILVQLSVFFTGPPLFYYLSLRISNNIRLANLLGFISLMLSGISSWFILQPGGVPTIDVSYFSAESTINAISFFIFIFQITIGLSLLLFDLIVRMHTWKQNSKQSSLYTALYSAPILFYILIGSIDQSSIITDWLIVVLRIFYVASFLLVYLIIAQEKSLKDTYLVKQNSPLIR